MRHTERPESPPPRRNLCLSNVQHCSCAASEHAVGILHYSSFVYQEMPDEVQAEEEDGWKRDGDLLAAEIERQRPGVYTFACHGVET